MQITSEVGNENVSLQKILYLFLLNMNLLTPEERSKIVRIMNTMVVLPIEKEFYESK